jgi:hypothetical protein
MRPLKPLPEGVDMGVVRHDALPESAPNEAPGGLITRLISPDDPAWRSFLAASEHDVYHIPEYVAVSAGHEGGRPSALHVTHGPNALLLPLVLRDIAGGGRDVASPYGYPGPLVRGPDAPAFLAVAMREGARFLRREGFVSLFVRSHPILGPALPATVGTLVEHGPTVAVDLTLSRDTLWAQLRRSHRRDILRAVEAGHEVTLLDGDRDYRAFASLYRETMARVGAGSYYLFDEAYFGMLREGLAEHLVLAAISQRGRFVSAGIYTVSRSIVQAHLAATDPRIGIATAPATKLLDWSMALWSKAAGRTWFSLGGGRGGSRDTLLQYKEGFSPTRMPFHSLRLVLDEERYGQLVAARGLRGDPLALTGFFPLYRAHAGQS